MLESMEKLILEQQMIPPGSTVLCAVSGGADSICLLHALYQLRPRLGFQLAAAHYNHKLRGEEAEQDAQFVAQFVSLCCGTQALPDGGSLPPVPLYSGSGDVAGAAREWGIGLEEAGRELRYAFLRQTAREIGAQRIATGHNADDNAETILFHLARGSGLRGLGGIQPVRDDLIRPLLTTPRREVDAYLSLYALPHREDHTNRDNAYSRNRIRHQVIPVLEDLYPGFALRAAETAARLRADEVFLDELARSISSTAQPTGNGLSLSAAALGEAPLPVAIRGVRQLLGRLNGGDQNCSSAHLESVLALCRGDDPSAQIDLPNGLMARREYEQLILCPRCAPPPAEATPLPMPGQAVFGPWVVSCMQEIYEGQPQTPFSFWLSQSAAPTLTLRPRKTGDRLTLPGRPGKSVKKWLIDEKIPRLSRDTLPLFECSGIPAAVAALGPDAAFLPQPGEASWHIKIID